MTGNTEADNVIGLNGRPSSAMEPSEPCVNTLRDLLERAEAGEVIGVGIAAVHHDGDASYYLAGCVGGFGMQGALDMVRADLTDINRGEL